jgi:hypothetical protein
MDTETGGREIKGISTLHIFNLQIHTAVSDFEQFMNER